MRTGLKVEGLKGLQGHSKYVCKLEVPENIWHMGAVKEYYAVILLVLGRGGEGYVVSRRSPIR
jgi:hypothetical protein